MALKRSSDYQNTFRDLPAGRGLAGLARAANRTYGRVRSLPGPWTSLVHNGVAATLTTALTGTNNDLKYTAKDAGADGNSITIAYVDPPGNNVALSVAVVGKAITVTCATDGSSAITSTAAQVSAAIAANADADALVSVTNAPSNNGTGVVTALAPTNLTGGSDVQTFGHG